MSQRIEVSVPGATLVAETEGAGEGALFLHGFGSDRRSWDGVWPDLAVGRRLIRYDLRGFGESVASDRRPYRHARDLEAVLDALEIESCDLIGVSQGGAVALNFSLDHPERVRRLVLESPGMAAWDWSDDWRARWRQIVGSARSGDLAAARELWWRHPLFATTRASPAAEQLRASIQSYSGSHWAGKDTEEAALPDIDRLGLLKPSTLLLTGAADLPDFRLIADAIEAAAPNVRRVDYADAGHLLHLEHPARFVADVAAFLAS